MGKRIVITGGHLTPALAVISELKKGGDWQVCFIGRKHALEGEKTISVEYKTINNLGIPFFNLTTGRLQRSLTRYTIPSVFKIPFGFIQAFFLLNKIKPDVILSFGGYLALPVVFASWLKGVPVLTHEQTAVPGLANRIIAFFAQKICVSWPQTLKFFPKKKVVLTGNPIRREIFKYQISNIPSARVHSESSLRGAQGEGKYQISNEDLPLIYITGGSLGAHSINAVVGQILQKLLSRYRIIHQCGQTEVYKDYDKLSIISCQLSDTIRRRYFLTKYVENKDIGWVLNSADLVISRAGANTISELAVLGKPAILIPLPWAGGGEQMENAKILKKVGMVEILEQQNLTGKTLLRDIDMMLKNIGEYHQNCQTAKKLIRLDAERQIVRELETLI